LGGTGCCATWGEAERLKSIHPFSTQSTFTQGVMGFYSDGRTPGGIEALILASTVLIIINCLFLLNLPFTGSRTSATQ
jgi:hypothetical protein